MSPIVHGLLDDESFAAAAWDAAPPTDELALADAKPAAFVTAWLELLLPMGLLAEPARPDACPMFEATVAFAPSIFLVASTEAEDSLFLTIVLAYLTDFDDCIMNFSIACSF